MHMKLSPTVVEMINNAHDLSEDTDNTEYVRGQAELIAQFIPCDGDAGIYEDNIEIISKMITERR